MYKRQRFLRQTEGGVDIDGMCVPPVGLNGLVAGHQSGDVNGLKQLSVLVDQNLLELSLIHI